MTTFPKLVQTIMKLTADDELKRYLITLKSGGQHLTGKFESPEAVQRRLILVLLAYSIATKM